MHTHKLNNLLLKPSLLSGFICTVFAVAVPVAVNWSYVLNNLLFYDYFFGNEGVVTVLRDNPSDNATVGTMLTSQSFSHAATVIAGTLAAGLGLFIAIKLVAYLFNSISITLKEMRAVDTPAKHIVERELSKRLMIRFIVALLWTLYTLIFIKVVIPFAILVSQIGLDSKSQVSTGIYYTLFAGILLYTALHVHVIMARLLFLRPRVFGGQDAILSE